MNCDDPNSKPPSGPWSGYYLYVHAGSKHRMRLGLTFTADGKVSGEGIDDIAPFTITGFFDSDTNQARWTKAYIRQHAVEYRGIYNQRSICGDWTLLSRTGGFWIWPSELEETEGEEGEEGEVAEPTEVVLAHR